MNNEHEEHLEQLVKKANTALYSMNKPDLAIDIAKEILSRQPDHLPAYRILTQAYMDKNDEIILLLQQNN